jgi:hypothetical protein
LSQYDNQTFDPPVVSRSTDLVEHPDLVAYGIVAFA